ncbi:MAG: SAM-dependent DNA methyltransferase [Candidatus Viridilinea halotolerans]|uniref:site-specific DNA-methyltransferase (adenine-specific) n=1 Tax=Candidatus Viridilinea halotolerans TaxID=2491704 RepID=A0A426UBS1_9CHLR|nr:MAG: SAM-dependent DNA methyltransferase [Candidatus Viridilinea halotolerans]
MKLESTPVTTPTANAGLIWAIAELLRGDYKQSDYGKVILPFTLLRRLDCVLAPTKQAVLAEYAQRKDAGYDISIFLNRAAGQSFTNTSRYDFALLLGDANNLCANLRDYVAGFSPNVRDIFERYEFDKLLGKLDSANLLYQVVGRFATLDLSPQQVSNESMGLMFEELIRRFAELSNETAGEHFTPREVIRLMVDLLFAADNDVLTKPGVVRSIYDPAAGTGGMLAVAEEHLRAMNPKAKLSIFGQELNEESYAICKADMLIKGYAVDRIICGNTLAHDGHAGQRFDYMLSNPPFGVEWKKVEDAVRKEHKQKGHEGRFGPGLPRVSDGSLLFLLHLLKKMRPAKEGGSRVAIVLNGSPLFTGGAGSGESEIRRWIIENDWLEAIVALPTDMFYNTGIATYIWVLSNKKAPERRGKVQLINGVNCFKKMRKSLGSKRKELSEADIAQIVQLYGAFAAGEQSKVFANEEFGYRTITVERPLRDADGTIQRDRKGQPKPDASLRDTENVPLQEDVQAYFAREVLPHVPDAWVDAAKTKVGYEIPFTRHFYVYTPPRPLEAIDADLQRLGAEIAELLNVIVKPGAVRA